MNKIYIFIKPFIIILIFTVTSCMPPAFIQLEPQSEDYYEEEFYETTELVLGADSVFQCWLSYEFKDGDFWVFYVHLVNQSVLSAQFDPAACYLEYSVSRQDMPGEPNLRVYAINPEVEIRSIAKEREETNNRNSMDLGFNILSAVFEIATNVFDGESWNDSEIFDDVVYYGGNIADNIEVSRMDSIYFEGSETFWKNEVLRKTIIQSGDETGGLVYFPIQKRSTEFSAIVPFGGTPNVFEIELR